MGAVKSGACKVRTHPTNLRPTFLSVPCAMWPGMRLTTSCNTRVVRLILFVALQLALSGCVATSPPEPSPAIEISWTTSETGPGITVNVVAAKTGWSIEGVTVQVENSVAGAVTDQGGWADIRDVPPGRHSLVVSMVGFTPIEIPAVLVEAGHTTIIKGVRLKEVDVRTHDL